MVPACRYRAQDVHPVPPLRRADGMMPVAVVFLDRGAAGPTEIVRAARGLCETVLLYRGDREYPASIRPVSRRSASCWCR